MSQDKGHCIMNGQIAWLRDGCNSFEKVLHWRNHPNSPWCHYLDHVEALPELDGSTGSQGWATFQKLLSLGYKLVPNSAIEMIPSIELEDEIYLNKINRKALAVVQ